MDFQWSPHKFLIPLSKRRINTGQPHTSPPNHHIITQIAEKAKELPSFLKGNVRELLNRMASSCIIFKVHNKK